MAAVVVWVPRVARRVLTVPVMRRVRVQESPVMAAPAVMVVRAVTAAIRCRWVWVAAVATVVRAAPAAGVGLLRRVGLATVELPVMAATADSLLIRRVTKVQVAAAVMVAKAARVARVVPPGHLEVLQGTVARVAMAVWAATAAMMSRRLLMGRLVGVARAVTVAAAVMAVPAGRPKLRVQSRAMAEPRVMARTLVTVDLRLVR